MASSGGSPNPSARCRDTYASHEATKRAGIDFVDPTPWFCAYDVCPVVIGSDVAYRDREHISTAYSTQLAPTLADALDIGPGDPSASAPKQTSN